MSRKDTYLTKYSGVAHACSIPEAVHYFTAETAAGCCTPQGIVLCADTQEIIPGWVKTNTDKIQVLSTEHCTMAITGPGDDSYLVEMASQDIMAAMESETPKNINEIKLLISRI